MRISKVDMYMIELPLNEPFIISYARYDTMPAIIIKMYTDQGIIGYGESVPDEHVTGESVHSVFDALKYQLIPAVIDKDPRNILEIHELMNAALVGNGAAKAAVDIACYDILGKASNLPIYSLLGGRKRDQPMIPEVFSILEPDVLAKKAIQARNNGYKEIKMKLGIDSEKDVARVQAVREAIGEDLLIRVDVNQGWGSFQKAKQMIKKLEPFDVTWVEQPIAQMDLSMFQRLQESSPTPLMADESLINAQHLRTLVEHQSVDYINIKLMKSGGIYPAYQLATQAELFGINCQIGSMVESSIASAAGFHVALAKKNIVSTEISGPTKFTKDVGDLTYSLPYANITNKPGLGINVDDAVIKELTTRSEEMML
ncbi:dipeptide epimerase [Alkalihalophilus marmarensis]|uniref:Dipeptide epimerase n=1 Tax=Alkalihalophilus marmarensis DSM 21297 TaxID=1188261 RepID=U6SUM7_9BACI|nr:dipeptide epimerase [Alkalihalophilus marmarensis]ERN55092.1 mandelate racemase [Alkalihalophilus marmarensis DSM 21297]MCM3489268.1 dipeptide epimerase [Alkalihalophilus marmarensis]